MATISATTTSKDGAPPFVRRLFGEHWDSLDEHPDFWNRLFGPDSDNEDEQDEAVSENQLLEQKKKGAKNLTDHNWIKQRLDEEVHRFLTEELLLQENHSITNKRAKLLLVALIVGVLAQFPYLWPTDTELLKTLSVVLIAVFFLLFTYGHGLAFQVPWNTIVETRPSSETAKDELYVETDMPRYQLGYEIKLRSKRSKSIFEKRAVSATLLFTPAGRMTPEPLHSELREMLAAIRTKCLSI
jgi:hypothetical protein